MLQKEKAIQSLADAGYRQAKLDSAINTVTRYAMEKIPTLGDPTLSRSEQMTEDDRTELKKGYALWYGEAIKPERYFAVVDGQIIEKTADGIEKLNCEKWKLSVSSAFSYDQSTLNSMKENSRSRYDLVQSLRTDFNAYASNRIGDIIKKAIKIRSDLMGLKRERIQALEFAVFEKKTLAELEKRVRNADSRGNDPSADVALVKRRIAAYWSVK